ncbi:MAG: DUF3301 domain-containing protein [Pseudomonadales bacterium]|nr:DUF3301 domain-containing protein [Pseudomonadales bacterium]MCP5215560.1 DUF3301 domain-containing protein [Pseudomonadales bacterium]
MYLELSHLLWTFVILSGFSYWWHAYGIKQTALQQTKAYCQKMDLQMLDESIALNRVTIKRDSNGHINFIRVFRFEFASTGDERYQELTTMHGRHCQNIHLDAHKI